MIANGNPEAPITIRGEDEIGSLAYDFDMMRQSVKEAESFRQAYQTRIEQEVRERTHELSKEFPMK